MHSVSFCSIGKVEIRLSAASLIENAPTKAAAANHHQIIREFLFNWKA